MRFLLHKSREMRRVLFTMAGSVMLIFGAVCALDAEPDDGTSKETLKVGVVNVREVYRSYERAKEARQKIINEKQNAEKKLRKLKEKSQRIKQELDELEPMGDHWKERAKKYYELQAQMKLLKDFWKGDQQKLLGQMSVDIYKDIQKVIEAYGDKHGFDIILKTEELKEGKEQSQQMSKQIANRSVLYFRSRMDITDKIISILNEQYNESSSKDNESSEGGS